MTTTKFILKDLNCDACLRVSKMKLEKIEGITAIRLVRQGQEADGEIEAEREISLDEIKEALLGTKYKVSPAKE